MWLTASRQRVCGCLRSRGEGGMMLMSAPVSTCEM